MHFFIQYFYRKFAKKIVPGAQILYKVKALVAGFKLSYVITLGLNQYLLVCVITNYARKSAGIVNFEIRIFKPDFQLVPTLNQQLMTKRRIKTHIWVNYEQRLSKSDNATIMQPSITKANLYFIREILYVCTDK